MVPGQRRLGMPKVVSTVTFTQSYTDNDGNWHESEACDGGDLLNLAELADQAHTRVFASFLNWQPPSHGA